MGKVELGYAVPSGEPYWIPIHHTVITGMTSLSGKTTTEEAILSRLPENYKCLVFLTKRGEKTFTDAPRIRPYYKERFDWEYVRGLLESAMHERMKFETPWIIRISKRVQSLQGFRDELQRELDKKKLREFDRNIYTLLAAYLDKVLPTLNAAKHQFTSTLDLQKGINVMDLTEWYVHEEVQMLVIRACMEYILAKENYVIVGLPEAWKMLPQSRNTPVKLFFEKFIREGATNNNYLHIDAQDLGGVDKTPLRQVSVWIMGKMMEANEAERVLKQTLGLSVKATEIQTLMLGHFLVATGKNVVKVYVRPNGVPESLAMSVARMEKRPGVVQELLAEQRNRQVQAIDAGLVSTVGELTQLLREHMANPVLHRLDTDIDPELLVSRDTFEAELDTLRETFQKFRQDVESLMVTASQQSGNMNLEQTMKKVEVSRVPKSFKMTDESPEGKVMVLASEGYFDKWKDGSEVQDCLTERGWTIDSSPRRPNLNRALSKLVDLGFLGKHRTGGVTRWKLAPNVRFE